MRRPTRKAADFHLFLSIFDTSQEAVDALRLFRENLIKKGKLEAGTSTQFGSDALIGADPVPRQNYRGTEGSVSRRCRGF